MGVRFGIICRVLGILLLCAMPLRAQAEGTGATVSDATKEQAKQHFERGLEMFKREAWDPALAEFLRSRSLYPTRGNTQNAAVCLSKLERYDEALDMFEALLAEFPSLPDRAQVESEVKTLRGLVGSIEVRLGAPGASVVVDGRVRGVTPLGSPIRVSSGSHVVRVFKEGAAPYEVRVEIAGGENEVVEPKLTLLTRAGRLKVSERNGKRAEVVLDGVVVGRTPWEGSLEPGTHSVVLRGEGNLGTQPVRAPVRVDDATIVTLALELLECDLRIDPVPLSATLALDGVELGRGTWEGRLRCGSHKLEARAEGFLLVQRSVTLTAGASKTERIELDRDPEFSDWQKKNPPRIFIGLNAYALVSPTLGGDVSGTCSGSCERSLPLGAWPELEVGYQFGSGIALSMGVGALAVRSNVRAREVVTREVPNGTAFAGTEDDRLTMYGLTLGAAVGLERGDSPFWMVRLGAGVLLGTLEVRRSAEMDMGLDQNNQLRGIQDFGPASQRYPARYVYVAPEIRVWTPISVVSSWGLHSARRSSSLSRSRPGTGRTSGSTRERLRRKSRSSTFQRRP